VSGIEAGRGVGDGIVCHRSGIVGGGSGKLVWWWLEYGVR